MAAVRAWYPLGTRSIHQHPVASTRIIRILGGISASSRRRHQGPCFAFSSIFLLPFRSASLFRSYGSRFGAAATEPEKAAGRWSHRSLEPLRHWTAAAQVSPSRPPSYAIRPRLLSPSLPARRLAPRSAAAPGGVQVEGSATLPRRPSSSLSPSVSKGAPRSPRRRLVAASSGLCWGVGGDRKGGKKTNGAHAPVFVTTRLSPCRRPGERDDWLTGDAPPPRG